MTLPNMNGFNSPSCPTTILDIVVKYTYSISSIRRNVSNCPQLANQILIKSIFIVSFCSKTILEGPLPSTARGYRLIIVGDVVGPCRRVCDCWFYHHPVGLGH